MNSIKNLIRSIFRILGFTIQRNRSGGQELSMIQALGRLKKVGLKPSLIIDGGAASGKWTEVSKRIFPNARYTLLEPIPDQVEAIEKSLLNKTDRIIQAVLGKENGKVSFNVTDDLDGSGVYGSTENAIEVDVVPLKELINDDILLKLDTHGYEIQIFEGIGDKWGHIQCIIVEVYGFHVSPTAVLFHEISAYLSDKGYRMYDLINVMRRPGDEAFWQADAIYLKSSHPVFKQNGYRIS